ncbi:MAG: TonB-dependent receptor [Humidesulfovibrio sp.]|uniref:TonB-dependent receptor n=1 Tax=Humidesulfovibrio sp. TaxID=2910988 RepID=UPI0027F8456A|nr:TonB-dependent receptor [Humidesulfovibrio sp.]MDQ7835558.1 TonB-dependent receptor [Humidesulfovibrio sp.]
MRIFLCVLLLLTIFPLAALAKDDSGGQANSTSPGYVMDEVVVSASRAQEPIRQVPRNVTVITREEIERSGGNSITDLLARQVGVSQQNYFGTDRNSLVDLRGQGNLAAQNVLVMVDGQRITPVDMAAAPLNTVPLSEVERIEIVRGPGGVIYGDRAVGGVINIITRKGDAVNGFSGSVGAGYGSFDSTKYNAAVRGRDGSVYGSVGASTSDTTGYRANGALWQQDALGSVGWEANKALTLSLSSAYHEDRYGQPGGVSRAAALSRDARRMTSSPNDWGQTTDGRIQGGAKLDLDAFGSLDYHLGYRTRENPYAYGATKYKINDETANSDLTYTVGVELLGLKHMLRLGGDGWTSHYTSGSIAANRNTSDVWSAGGFAHDAITLVPDLTLQLGYRYNRYDAHGEDIPDKTWNNNAYELGLVYDLTKKASLYASYASTFRTPTVDELNFQTGTLKPQTSKSLEAGVRAGLLDNLEGNLSVFRSATSDEIWYDGSKGAWGLNSNYENDVIRKGIEAELRYRPFKVLGLKANYAYVEAKFDQTGTIVPLVPKHTAKLSADWDILSSLLFNVSGTYVSSKQVNAGNTLPPIWSYTVVDTKLTWTIDTFKVYAGVNNLFDSCYTTMAFGNTSYYVMPTRNFYSGVEWSF